MIESKKSETTVDTFNQELREAISTLVEKNTTTAKYGALSLRHDLISLGFPPAKLPKNGALSERIHRVRKKLKQRSPSAKENINDENVQVLMNALQDEDGDENAVVVLGSDERDPFMPENSKFYVALSTRKFLDNVNKAQKLKYSDGVPVVMHFYCLAMGVYYLGVSDANNDVQTVALAFLEKSGDMRRFVIDVKKALEIMNEPQETVNPDYCVMSGADTTPWLTLQSVFNSNVEPITNFAYVLDDIADADTSGQIRNDLFDLRASLSEEDFCEKVNKLSWIRLNVWNEFFVKWCRSGATWRLFDIQKAFVKAKMPSVPFITEFGCTVVDFIKSTGHGDLYEFSRSSNFAMTKSISSLVLSEVARLQSDLANGDGGVTLTVDRSNHENGLRVIFKTEPSEPNGSDDNSSVYTVLLDGIDKARCSCVRYLTEGECAHCFVAITISACL